MEQLELEGKHTPHEREKDTAVADQIELTQDVTPPEPVQVKTVDPSPVEDLKPTPTTEEKVAEQKVEIHAKIKRALKRKKPTNAFPPKELKSLYDDMQQIQHSVQDLRTMLTQQQRMLDLMEPRVSTGASEPSRVERAPVQYVDTEVLAADRQAHERARKVAEPLPTEYPLPLPTEDYSRPGRGHLKPLSLKRQRLMGGDMYPEIPLNGSFYAFS